VTRQRLPQNQTYVFNISFLSLFHLPCSDFRDGFFYRDVLAKEQADLEELGSLSGQLTLILGIGAVLTFVLVAAGTRSLGKVGPTSHPLSPPCQHQVGPNFCTFGCWHPLTCQVGPFSSPLYPRVRLGASSSLYCGCYHPLTWQGWSSLPSPQPQGRPHLCTRGHQHLLIWQGWSSLPCPQPRGFLTFVLVTASTRSLGKVGTSFPLPRHGVSSPVYLWLPAPAPLETLVLSPPPFIPMSGSGRSSSLYCGSLGNINAPFLLPSLEASSPLYLWLPAPAHLERLVLPSLSPAWGRPHLCTHGCRHPLTWKGLSIPFLQPQGVLILPAHLERLVHSLSPASGCSHLTRSLGKVGPFPLPSLGAVLTLTANLARLVHSLFPATGHPYLCTCGCRHPITWQGLSSLPCLQPQSIFTCGLVAVGTSSLGKVGTPFPVPSLGAVLTLTANLARLVHSLSPDLGLSSP
jgi:hypothetical protein